MNLLSFRAKLQKAKSTEELEFLTLKLSESLKDRYKPIHVLAEEGNIDVLQRLNFLLNEVDGKIFYLLVL